MGNKHGGLATAKKEDTVGLAVSKCDSDTICEGLREGLGVVNGNDLATLPFLFTWENCTAFLGPSTISSVP